MERTERGVRMPLLGAVLLGAVLFGAGLLGAFVGSVCCCGCEDDEDRSERTRS